MKALLKVAVPLPKLESFDRYLFVGPHPDDIEIAAGGTAAKLVACGKQVTFLICTDGRYGTSDTSISPDDLAATRRQEAVASAMILGVTDVRFLDYRDGGNNDLYAMTIDVAKVICDTRAQCVFGADPTVISECHIDHLMSGEATRRAALLAGTAILMQEHGATAFAPSALAFYYTAKPNRYVKIGACHTKRFDAIKAHRSQFLLDTKEGLDAYNGIRLYLNIRAIRFGMRKCTKYAEGFRALSSIHMHCAPEASDF